MSENKGFFEKTKEAASNVKESVKDSFQNATGNTAEAGEAGIVKSGQMNQKASERGAWNDKGMDYQGPDEEQKMRHGN